MLGTRERTRLQGGELQNWKSAKNLPKRTDLAPKQLEREGAERELIKLA